MGRTTAHWGGDFATFVPVPRERAEGGVMHGGEGAAIYTSSERRGGGGGGRAVEGGGGVGGWCPAFHRPPPPSTALWLRCREHPDRKQDPPPADQPTRDSGRADEPRQGVQDARPVPRAGEHSERRAHQRRHAAVLREQCAGRLEATAVADARRTDGLTAAAAETAVEVQGDARIGGRELARLERAHQLDAAARAVGFVTGREERRAGLETEAAMHTGVQPFEAAPIRHSVPSTATTNASPGSNVRRSPATSGPTPSR